MRRQKFRRSQKNSEEVRRSQKISKEELKHIILSSWFYGL
jgi:hypothetical protein